MIHFIAAMLGVVFTLNLTLLAVNVGRVVQEVLDRAEARS